MKKYLFVFSIFFSAKAFAQVPEDAIRYSWNPQSGSARSLAIGGAMGSLGGDISATFVNPAGLGFYKTQEFVFTPSFAMNKNKANFRGSSLADKKNSLSLGTTGLIFGVGDNDYSKKSVAYSFAITQSANLNNITHYKGLNNLSSFSEQFAEEFAASGLSIDQVLNVNSPLPFSSAPALYTYLIDTARINGSLQVRAAPENILDAGQALQQEYLRKTKGGVYDLAFGMAMNDNKKLLLGATLGVPIVDYTSTTTFTEIDTSMNNMNGFKSFNYEDNYTTRGIGVNVKLGAIYRPAEYIRLGLALHTPSFMWMTDERTTSLRTNLETPSGAPESFEINSNEFTNGEPGQNRYVQMSPWKAILSASYVFREEENIKRQRGFITADVEYVNHKGSRFTNNNEGATSRDKEYTKQLNRVISDYYKGAFNFRVGGELKFNVLMTRLGFAYYGDPNKNAPYKANRMLMSGGLGYRNDGFFIDLTYVHQISKDANMPYILNGQDNTFATLRNQQSNVVATIGVKF